MKKLAIALAAVLLIAAIAYFFLFRTSPERIGPVPELLTLAPADSEWMLYVDVAAWRSSPILEDLQKLIPEVREDPGYREFVRATGFDYSHDLDRAVIALLPVPGPALRRRSPYQVVVFAEGRFDREKILAYALKSGSKETHDGVEIILASGTASTKLANGESDSALFAFLTNQRVALADVPGGESNQLVRGREAILAANRASGQPAAPTPIADRAARVAGAPFFAVGRADSLAHLKQGMSQVSPVARQVAGILSNVQWLTVAVRPEGEQVRASVYGECDSIWKATQLGLLFEGLLLLSRSAIKDPQTRAQLGMEQAAQLDAVLANAKVERHGSTVEVRLQIPVALLAAPSAPAKR